MKFPPRWGLYAGAATENNSSKSNVSYGRLNYEYDGVLTPEGKVGDSDCLIA